MRRVEGEVICRWAGENMDDPCTLTGNELKNAINPDDVGKGEKRASTVHKGGYKKKSRQEEQERYKNGAPNIANVSKQKE